MTKSEAIQAAKDKQELNEARRVYKSMLQQNYVIKEIQLRFGLFPVVLDID